MLYGFFKFIHIILTVKVLILIFLENALRQSNFDMEGLPRTGLNPYFFGKCSTAFLTVHEKTFDAFVLILIFLENALRR